MLHTWEPALAAAPTAAIALKMDIRFITEVIDPGPDMVESKRLGTFTNAEKNQKKAAIVEPPMFSQSSMSFVIVMRGTPPDYLGKVAKFISSASMH